MDTSTISKPNFVYYNVHRNTQINKISNLCVLCAQTISRPQPLTDTLQYYFPTCLFPDGRDESSGLIFNSHGWRMGDGQKEMQPKEK